MGLERSYESASVEQAQQSVKQAKEATKQAKQQTVAGKTLLTLLGSGSPIQNALMNSLDLSSISKEWETTFAQPAMEAWWKYNAPGIRDEFAGIPGGFFSADRGRGVGQAASQYMSQSVQPQLFSALQAARANMPSMISAVTNPLTSFGRTTTTPLAPVQDTSGPGAGPLVGGLLGMGLAGLTGKGALSKQGLRMGIFGSMAGGLFGNG